MFLCGQVYSAYIQAWKLPDTYTYRTNLNLTPATRLTQEVLDITGNWVSPNLLI